MEEQQTTQEVTDQANQEADNSTEVVPTAPETETVQEPPTAQPTIRDRAAELLETKYEIGNFGRLMATVRQAELGRMTDADDRRFRDFQHQIAKDAYRASGISCGEATTAETLPDDEMNVRFQSPENHYHLPQPAAPVPAAPPQQAPAAPQEQKQSSGLSKLIAPALIAAGVMGTGGIGAAAYLGGKAIDAFTERETTTTTDTEVVTPGMEIFFRGGQIVDE